jgi:hypothetical protein
LTGNIFSYWPEWISLRSNSLRERWPLWNSLVTEFSLLISDLSNLLQSDVIETLDISLIVFVGDVIVTFNNISSHKYYLHALDIDLRTAIGHFERISTKTTHKRKHYQSQIDKFWLLWDKFQMINAKWKLVWYGYWFN